MKKTTLFLAAIFAASSFLFAQEVQTPEFKNTPMLVKKDGSLEKLEKQNSEVKSKGGGYNPYNFSGKVATNDYIVFQGEASPVRVSTDATFVIKLADADTDPETTFYCTKPIIKKKTREVYTKKDAGRSVKEQMVKLDFEKVSPGVYKIKPKGLTAGTEYALVPIATTGGAQSIVYLFGTL